MNTKHFDVVVVGAGTAGITVASMLLRELKNIKVAIIDPADTHYYQPLYTLVGAGADDVKKTARPMASVIPKNADWIKEPVIGFEPDNNRVITNNSTYQYEYLVVAPGLQIDWDIIEGLKETLGKNGVCSVYGYKQSEDTWNILRNFKGGKAIFTAAWTPVKCGGASQKIMYLTDAFLRKKNLRNNTDIQFISSGTKIFAVPGFTETLEKLIKEKDIGVRFKHDLIKVDGTNKKAWFRVHTPEKEDTIIEENFDLLHVVPPQSAPDFIKNSPLAINEGPLKGWMDVDKYTLKHVNYENVYGLGDVAGLPTAKTGAAVRKQAPVVAEAILSKIKKESYIQKSLYNGYSACPIVTDYHHVLLAEFGYNNEPMPSFPIDTTKPRFSMYLLKHYVLPWFYWNRMLKGKG